MSTPGQPASTRTREHRRIGGDILDFALGKTLDLDLIEAALHIALTDLRLHRTESRRNSPTGGSRNHEHNNESHR